MSILRLKTRQFNLKSNAIQSKEKKIVLHDRVCFFFSLSSSLTQPKTACSNTRRNFFFSSSLFLDCNVKQPFPPKRKKKLRVFHRRKNQSRALENQNLTHASPALTPFSRSVPSFICFLVHVPGVGAKFMSGFFFFLCFFSCLFLSRKNCSSFLLFLLLFFLLLSRETLFSGGEKKKRKNISLERSARFRSEREKNIRTTTYAREVQKERKLSPLLLLPSLFLSLLCCSFRGGEQSVSSVCDKKGVLEYFRDDRPKRERSEEKRKRGGSGFS